MNREGQLLLQITKCFRKEMPWPCSFNKSCSTAKLCEGLDFIFRAGKKAATTPEVERGDWRDGINCETCLHKETSHSDMPCFTCGRRKFDYYEPESGATENVGEAPSTKEEWVYVNYHCDTCNTHAEAEGVPEGEPIDCLECGQQMRYKPGHVPIQVPTPVNRTSPSGTRSRLSPFLAIAEVTEQNLKEQLQPPRVDNNNEPALEIKTNMPDVLPNCPKCGSKLVHDELNNKLLCVECGESIELLTPRKRSE